jgi:hypothetical protein
MQPSQSISPFHCVSALCIDLLLVGALAEGFIFEGLSDSFIYLLSLAVLLRVVCTRVRLQWRVSLTLATLGVVVGIHYFDKDDTFRLPLIGILGLVIMLHARMAPLLVIRAWYVGIIQVVVLFGLGVYLHEWWYCDLSGEPCNFLGKTQVFSLLILAASCMRALYTPYGSWLEALYSRVMTLVGLVAGGYWVFISAPRVGVDVLLGIDSSVGYLAALLLALARFLAVSATGGIDSRKVSLLSAAVVTAILSVCLVLTVYAVRHLDERIPQLGANRFPVPESLSVPLLVSEDPTFFFHHGLDLVRIRDAIRETMERGSFHRGGSTISMQLAKVIYLSHEKTLVRKGVQIILGVFIEQLYSKDTILLAYLNGVPMAPGVVGVPTAARAFFSRMPAELNESENLELILTIYDPTEYSSNVSQMPPAVAARARTIRARERVFSATLKRQLQGCKALQGVTGTTGSPSD